MPRGDADARVRALCTEPTGVRAACALAWTCRRSRRQGDATDLVVLCASFDLESARGALVLHARCSRDGACMLMWVWTDEEVSSCPGVLYSLPRPSCMRCRPA